MKPRDLINRPRTASEAAKRHDAMTATHNAALAAELRAQQRAKGTK